MDKDIKLPALPYKSLRVLRVHEGKALIECQTLEGDALNWAVAEAAQEEAYIHNGKMVVYRADSDGGNIEYSPSTIWAQGGPIIEREALWVREYAVASPAIAHLVTPDKKWFAYASRSYDGGTSGCYYGETFLIAAMRCYVASKLGNEVAVPKELI